jgi:hypothetical protein
METLPTLSIDTPFVSLISNIWKESARNHNKNLRKVPKLRHSLPFLASVPSILGRTQLEATLILQKMKVVFGPFRSILPEKPPKRSDLTGFEHQK